MRPLAQVRVPDWPAAACANEDPELFFPELNGGVGAKKQARLQAALARSVCGECGLRIECLTRALELKVRDGVWGGIWFHDGKRQGA